MIIGIMAAEPEEILGIQNELQVKSREIRGDREYWCGKLHDTDVVAVFGKCGKVAAAQTATVLIERYGAECVIFSGVGGGVGSNVNIGDIVIADKTIQYDVDITALGAGQFEMPLTRQKYFEMDSATIKLAAAAANDYLTKLSPELMMAMAELNISNPRVHVGTIASGDTFIASAARVAELASQIDNLNCLEMEGAAVALVCYEYRVPCVVLRTISDNSGGTAHVDYPKFLNTVATVFLSGIVCEILKKYRV